MREDMAKILVERPRTGGGGKYPRAAIRGPLDHHPLREPIKSPLLRHRKFLNENLAPLRRFLRSRLGQPWDNVYSEICERINRDSAVQLHIWQHLMWEVARDPLQIEKLRRRISFGWRASFYVDPKSRRLCEMQLQSRRHQVPDPFLVEREGRSFKRINGIWYEVELEPLDASANRVWDAVVSRMDRGQPHLVEASVLKSTYGRPVHAIRKRQLNKKEIQRLVATLKDEVG
jgi:hypothetical protein